MARILTVGFLSTPLWFPIPLAQAHAELVSSTPSIGANLAALPSQVSVTFDNTLLNIGGSRTNVLVVRNSRGVEIDAKNSTVSGARLTVGLLPMPMNDKFSVNWRVVAGDGHPEVGSYQFTVGNNSAVPSPMPSRSPSSTYIPISVTQNFWSNQGSWLLLLAGFLSAIGIWIQFERKRRNLK